MLVAGLILVSLPFLGSIPVLGHLAVLALAVWRYRIQVTGGKLPPAWLRLMLFLGSVAACFVIYGTLLNMEAATFLLLILVGLKVLELRNSRDFALVSWLCTFLVLAALFFTSSLPLFLYQLLALLLVIGALIMLHGGMSSGLKFSRVFGRTVVIFLQALPVVVGLYLLFPRLSGGPFTSPLARQQAVTGLSNNMDPGSFASLARNDDPVMRVSFPQGEIPRQRDLYWRAQVFWDCDAFAWDLGDWLNNYTEYLHPREVRPANEEETVLQRIIMEPHNDRWVFALDRPVSRPVAGWGRNVHLKTGQFLLLRADQRVTNTRQYDVISHPVQSSPQTGRSDVYAARQRALGTGNEPVPEALTALAWQLSRDHFDAESFVRDALEYLARGGKQEPPGDDVIRQLAQPWQEGPVSHRQLLENAVNWAVERNWIRTSDYTRKLQHQTHIWIGKHTDSAAVAERVINWYRENGFLYTTSPGRYAGGWAGVEDFLLERRRGFCEHYAGSFGALMRLCGVPSRVVAGYQGGAYNRLGNHLLVRQSDAHAWNEIYILNEGWRRVDLTQYVAADRIDFGMEAWTELERVGPTSNSDRVAALTRFSTRGGIGELLRNIEFAWDAADYYWNVYILSYDEEAQTSLLGFLDLGNHGFWKLILAIILLMVGIMAVYLLAAQTTRRKPDATGFTRDYERFLGKLQRNGLSFSSTDGPLVLAEKARAAFPGVAQEISQIFHTYIRAVYSPHPLGDEDFRQWRRQIRRLRVPRNED